jgi:hypothetical protein
MICMGTIPSFMHSILFDEVTETARDVRQLGKQVLVIRTLSSILVYMRHNRLPVDNVGRDALLVGTYGRENAVGSRVDLLTTVADDADDYFLPTILTPDLAAVALT